MSPWLWIPVPILLFFGLMGFKDGVVRRILEIVGILVTLLLTARFAASVHPEMMDRTGLEEGPALLLTWVVLFIAGLLLSRLIAGLASKLVRLTILGWLDRGGGVLVGLAVGVLVSSVLLVAASQVPGGGKIQTAYDENAVGRFVFYAAPNLYLQVRKLNGGKAEEVWSRVLRETRDQAGEAAGQAKDAASDAAKDVLRESLGSADDGDSAR